MKFLVPREQAKAAGVYLIKAEGSDAAYVGATQCFFTRYKAHLGSLKNSTHINSRVQQLAVDFGVENMSFNFLEAWDKGNSITLATLEEKWIAIYDAGGLLNRSRSSGIKEPNPTQVVSVTLSAELRGKFEFLASKERRPPRDLLRILIEDAVAAYEKEHGPIQLPPASSPTH